MTVLVYSEEYKKHDEISHPENQSRLNAMLKYIDKEDSLRDLDIVSPPAASKNHILKVHSKSHVNFIKDLCIRGGGNIDFDTYTTPDTYHVAKISAGGAITASKIVLESDQSAYSIGRPPGHHSNSERSMGFCIFNNIAIAIEYLREVYKIKKFLVLDCDVHYGNGTADIFYHDPSVLYISIHQDPRTIFPGQGFVEEMGEGAGEGFNLCLPMPAYSNTNDYIYILEKILKPVASQFKADFHFLDIGFDGHSNDPLSNTNLDDDFYPWITTQMKEIAHKIALILEGGYDHETLGRCNVKVLNALNNHNENNDYDVDLSHVSEETKSLFKTIEDNFSPFFEF
ncbi:MAG: histone deacetylase [Methanobacteriaceae archaeon]|nr:histone deacetylase [Methanobacteriaceae archaeon]